MIFEYMGSKHNLEEIAGKENLFSLKDSANPHAMGITKDGLTKLQFHFPMINISFGNFIHAMLDGNEILALEGIAQNMSDPSLPIIRSFGEVSSKSLEGFGKNFPMATLEARTVSRVFLKALGLTALYSEAEILAANSAEEHIEKEKTLAELFAENKELSLELNLSDEQRLSIYGEVLGIRNATPAQITEKCDIEAAKKVNTVLKEQLEKRNEK